jgi:hypothetical protein
VGNGDPVAAQALVACLTFFEEASAAGLTPRCAAMEGYQLMRPFAALLTAFVPGWPAGGRERRIPVSVGS